MIRARLQRNKATILVDSGAYSIWKGGGAIDIYRYIDFLQENHSWIGPYFNLDFIGPEDTEAAAERSFDNLRKMRRHGLDPIGVFHIGEPIHWLHRMLDLGCTYIALGGSVGKPYPEVHQWYKQVWPRLVDHNGLPLVKVHALGNGMLKSLKAFPWASADSTSWLYTAQRTARMTLDGRRNVSQRTDKLSSKGLQDIDELDGLDSDVFEATLTRFRIKREAFAERGRVAAIMRTWVTAAYYMDVQTKVREEGLKRFYPEGLINSYHGGNQAGIVRPPFRMYLVGGTNNIAYIIMAALGHPYVLASYFYINKGQGTKTHAVAVPLDKYARDPEAALSNTPQWASYREIIERYTIP